MKICNHVYVVGAGFTGAVISRSLAEAGYHVDLIERNHSEIGGNAFDYEDVEGNLIHKYGCHVFHTNKKEIMEYLEQFVRFYDYTHKVKALVEDKLVPIPINLNAIDSLTNSTNLSKKLSKSGESKLYLSDLLEHKDEEISSLGKYLLEHVYKKYSKKQWGKSIDEISSGTINRIPIYLDRNDNHFRDEYQKLPVGGYTKLINEILSHDNIIIHQGCEVSKLFRFSGGLIYSMTDNTPILYSSIIYTGNIDELFYYKYGILPRRTLKFYSDKSCTPTDYSALNYSDSEVVPFTRTVYYGKLQQMLPKGLSPSISEIAKNYDHTDIKSRPMYPIRNEESITLHAKYLMEVMKYENLFICGGQATYEDLDMSTTIERALKFSGEFIEKRRKLEEKEV